MTRARTAAIVAVTVVVAAAGAWAVRSRLGDGPAPVTTTVASPAGDTIEDLLMDLQVIPLDGDAVKPFTLAGLDGTSLAAGDLAGRPALLYFWATW